MFMTWAELKRPRAIRLWPIVLLGGIMAGETAADEAVADTGEPDDRVAQSRYVIVDQEEPFSLYPEGDLDHFLLEIEVPGILSWELEDWEGAQAPVASYFRDGVWERQGERDIRVQPGRIVVQIRRAGKTEDPEAARQLSYIRFLRQEDADPTEPNDTLETARETEFGEPVEMTLRPRLDRDFLRFEVTEPGLVFWTVEGWPPASGAPVPFVDFYDAEGNWLRGGEYDIRVSPGVYYAAVRASAYDFSDFVVAEAFQFTVHFIQDADSSEPNDDFASARAVEPGEWAELQLIPRLDRDFFRIETDTPGYLGWELEGWQGAEEPLVKLYDERKIPVGSSHSHIWTGARTVFAELRSASNPDLEAAVVEPFRIRFVLTEEPDLSEPNDSMETARDASLNEPISFRLEPIGDVDVFRWEIVEPMWVHLLVEAELEPGAVGASLQVRTVHEGVPVEDLVEQPVSLEPGTYFSFLDLKEGAVPAPAYVLEISARRGFQLKEPNDSPDTASKLVLDTPISVELTSRLDRDYARLELAEAGILSWDLKDPSGEVDVTLLTEEGAALPAQPDGSRVRGESVYVQFRSRNAGTTDLRELPEATFRFSVEWDQSEPNDSLANARELSFNEPYRLSLNPRGDHDMFKVFVGEPGLLRWSVENWKPVEEGFDLPHVVLRDSLGVALLQATTEFPISIPGTYYLDVSSWIFEEAGPIHADSFEFEAVFETGFGQEESGLQTVEAIMGESPTHYFRIRRTP